MTEEKIDETLFSGVDQNRIESSINSFKVLCAPLW